jgi:hypothetical protein
MPITSPRATWSARTGRYAARCARYTRLTNGFSRKVENHTAAGMTRRVFDIDDLVDLLVEAEKKPRCG